VRTTIARRVSRGFSVAYRRTLRFASVAATLVALATAPAAADADKPRVIPIAGGRVTVEGPAGYERVTIETKGKPKAASTCDARSGTHAQLFDLFKKLKKAVKSGRAAAVTPLLHFPFQANGDSPRTFKDAAELTAHFNEVFPPAVVKRIAAAEPAAIYCSGGAGMLGDGVIWGHTDDNGVIGADIVNL
jgi:hypothetical protein